VGDQPSRLKAPASSFTAAARRRRWPPRLPESANSDEYRGLLPTTSPHRRLARIPLARSDYDVRIAPRPGGGSATRREFPARCDLLDAMMPQRSGFEVCRRIPRGSGAPGDDSRHGSPPGAATQRRPGTGSGVNAYVTEAILDQGAHEHGPRSRCNPSLRRRGCPDENDMHRDQVPPAYVVTTMSRTTLWRWLMESNGVR